MSRQDKPVRMEVVDGQGFKLRQDAGFDRVFSITRDLSGSNTPLDKAELSEIGSLPKKSDYPTSILDTFGMYLNPQPLFLDQSAEEPQPAHKHLSTCG